MGRATKPEKGYAVRVKQVPGLRSCAFCNCSLGEQEQGVMVEGVPVHSYHEDSYRKELSDRIARANRRRFLYLPSLGGGKCSDER